ncbi:hypothetical protein QEW_3999 [Clostridioides difficile CD160]|nr:hypothetical protein QEW_3999 [Clostridioides difficile CD160]
MQNSMKQEPCDFSHGRFRYSILIVFLFTLFMWRFWKLGMRHYKSASS